MIRRLGIQSFGVVFAFNSHGLLCFLLLIYVNSDKIDYTFVLTLLNLCRIFYTSLPIRQRDRRTSPFSRMHLLLNVESACRVEPRDHSIRPSPAVACGCNEMSRRTNRGPE